MFVGDLVKLKQRTKTHWVGIITHVWNDLDVDVLFWDGEFAMCSQDLEVIDEDTSR